MTKLKNVDDASLGTEAKLETSHVEKQDPNNHSIPDENAKTRRNMTIKQNSNKMACKTKQEQEQVGASKPRVTRNRSKKTLDPSCESSIKRDKNKNNTDRERIVSPNHSITEYFSSLDLKQEDKLPDQESNKIVDQVKLAKKDNSTSRKIRLPKKVDLGNHKLTEYFAIRKSDRKLKKDADLERQQDLENKIVNEIQDGLEIKEFNDKGRGIVTTKEFSRGDFVIEYIGELIDRNTAQARESRYAKSKNVGCYMYYFKHQDKQYCIDATQESRKLGRLINHSRKGNLTSRIVQVAGVPHLVLFAKVDIPIGTELLYDYGDRNQESIKNHPWLNL